MQTVKSCSNDLSVLNWRCLLTQDDLCDGHRKLFFKHQFESDRLLVKVLFGLDMLGSFLQESIALLLNSGCFDPDEVAG